MERLCAVAQVGLEPTECGTGDCRPYFLRPLFTVESGDVVVTVASVAAQGGARWCGRTGWPPAGAALWLVNNLMVNICIL